MLRLTRDDVLLPEDTGDVWGENMIVIRLGARVGTKSKREQFTILRENRDADACALLRRVRAATASGSRLFPSSLARYARRHKQVQERHKAQCGWTPHSPRAGFATDCVAFGDSFVDVREAGRWVSESSLRRYVDVTTALDLGRRLKHANLSRAVAEAQAELLRYFPAGCFEADASWPRRRRQRNRQPTTASACRREAGRERRQGRVS